MSPCRLYVPYVSLSSFLLSGSRPHAVLTLDWARLSFGGRPFTLRRDTATAVGPVTLKVIPHNHFRVMLRDDQVS